MTLTLDMGRGERAGRSGATTDVAVRIATRFEDVADVWRELEQAAPHSGYQRLVWQEQFFGHLGDGQSLCLAVLMGADGRPGALLPLAVETKRGLTVASFIGGKHANFALGLWRPDFARNTTGAALQSALAEIARQAATPIDLFRLTNQPVEWAGMANPFHRLPHQPSPSFGYHLALEPDADAVLARVVSGASRRKLRKKEQVLGAAGPVTFKVADTAIDIARFTDAFLAFKAQRFRELGIHNVFDAPGMRDFIIAAAAGPDPAVELCALTIGDEPIALFGGTVANGRYSGMFNAMTSGPMTRESPGELLLHHLIRHCCARGLTTFDLGVGEARYKSNLCDGVDPLFDQFIAVSWRGHLAATAMIATGYARRRIKQSPILWSLVTRLRRARGG